MTYLKEGLLTLVKCKSKMFSTLVHLILVSCDVLDDTKTNYDQLCEVFVLIKNLHYLLNIWQESLICQEDSGSLKDSEIVSRTNQEFC